MDRSTCMIYGANGFTGRLVAKQAAALGLRPILAGRRAEPIETLAAEHGLPARAFDLADAEAARAALADVAVVASCAGPFSATSAPLIRACLATGTDYLDITGEIDVLVAARARDQEARCAGIAICPGVGFDVVPTDCLAAVLKESLPDATHLSLGFDVTGVPSAGTALTIVEALGRGGRVRADGAIVAARFGHRKRTIDFGNGEKTAVTLPLGDIATAYSSTAIPNIETFSAVPPGALGLLAVLNFVRPVLGLGFARGLLRRWARGAEGPSAGALRADRAYVWGEVRNAQGTTLTARVTTPNGYRFTAAATVMAIARLLASRPAPGYYTPSQLMGPRCVERVPGVTPIRLG